MHHAGNSSGIVDGAAAVLIGSEAAAKAHGLTRPRAHRVGGAVGADPTIMLTGPMPAARKALAKAGLTIDQIDLFEVNEAFAAVRDALHEGDGGAARQGQRERRRHRHGPPAGRHRRHDSGHPD